MTHQEARHHTHTVTRSPPPPLFVVLWFHSDNKHVICIHVHKYIKKKVHESVHVSSAAFFLFVHAAPGSWKVVDQNECYFER